MAVGAVPTRQDVELKRQIGLYAATAITVGNIIGSGIFRSLALAELAVTHPKTGGLYVFIRDGFGNAHGFVFGWANLWVIKPTVIASITSVFALYFCQVMGWPKTTEFGVGAAAILVLTFVNWLGVREGARTQSVLTTLKVIGILGLCLAAFTIPASHAASPMPVAEAASTKPPLIGFFVAMVSI